MLRFHISRLVLIATSISGAVFLPACVVAQQCAAGTARATIEVVDSTGAQIVGAAISLDGKQTGTSDAHGQWISACLVAGSHRIELSAKGFAVVQQPLSAGSPRITVRMRPVTVETTVDAVQDEPVSTESVAGTKTLEAKDIKQLADDPDEFQRQLQVLAAAAGGAPGQAIIAVDGFQNSGRIPPKSAIAFIDRKSVV